MASPRRILVMGASYGSLLATKLLVAGQNVSLVCRSDEADLINTSGTRLHIPFRGRESLVEIDSRKLPGKLVAMKPDAADPGQYDLVVLAMQEPQYRSSPVRELLKRTADSLRPVMSIMNMPPPPFLARIPGLDFNALKSCYSDPSIWDHFETKLFTQASPNPQTFRSPGQPPNVLQVTLATNFKVVRFEGSADTAMLLQLASAIEASRINLDGVLAELPVALKVHDSVFAPLGKWSMLMAGNYRCIEPERIRSIREAIHADLATSRDVYNWVNRLCRSIGAEESELVPFERYADVALSLSEPSSVARALASGATEIERVDRLIQSIAASKSMRHHIVDANVELVNSWLRRSHDGRSGPAALG